ncbi:MAG: 30S ribosomal protein S12 methylthiotransferase RimO [Clostridia bacterium]|nr:30S ribosomal protein S12 methylthiotransferase RimO [Clostridia bacterium]MDD4376062.1 30S ribosomal protein S12 methylthiotransferase RimO [Clostridia bacterium]
MKVSLVTLGCTKNQVDSEMIATYLQKRDNILTDEMAQAEVIIINTCGFINSAKEEAINTILELSDYKSKGNCKHIIVVGCLAKRYKKQIYQEIPEVDLVIGVDEYENFDNIFSKYFNITNSNYCLNFYGRKISSTFPMAYLRISDGCNNRCNYCAIPLIRGSLKSRRIENVLKEAKDLVSKGIQELCVISQDTTSYGIDIYGEVKLVELLKELSKLEGLKWIRILYMYPGKVSDELIEEMKYNNKICRYFDIPIQHISDNMLKAMNRHTSKQEIYDLVNKIRIKLPDAIIRTTIMTGYQGETEQDFKELLQAVYDLKFDRLGGFTFSKEEDTKAMEILGDIDEKLKQERYEKIMEAQQQVIKEKTNSLIGKELEVIVEDVTEDNENYICRSYMDAPDVDPKIYLNVEENVDKIIIGEYYNVILTKPIGYDFMADLKEE